jgi:hypothetical protein
MMRTAWAPGATAALISARCAFIALVSHHGSTKPMASPVFGQMAPKI